MSASDNSLTSGDFTTDDSLDVSSDIPSVLPNEDLSNVDLPGQFDSMPGGSDISGAFPGGAADPSGINSLFLSSGANPTPTGGYMSTLAQVAQSAATGFSTYAKGSPSVATPKPLTPGSTIAGATGAAAVASGQTNWLVIGAVIVVGLGVVAFLALR